MTLNLYGQNSYNTGVYGGIGILPTSYDECLDFIEAAPYISTKLRLISLLPSFRGSNNPSYQKGLTLISKENSESVLHALASEIFTFVKELTPEEISLFDYIQSDYIEANPGIKGNAYASYVGTYYDTDGEPT